MKIKVIVRLILYRCITCYVATGGLLSKWKKGAQFFLTLFHSVVKRSPWNLGRSFLPSKFSRLSVVTIPVRWICWNVWTLGFLENCPSERSLYVSFERSWDDCGKISHLYIFPLDLLVYTMYIFLRNTIFVDFEPALRTQSYRDLLRAEILQSNDTQHSVTGQKHRFDWILLNETCNIHCFL